MAILQKVVTTSFNIRGEPLVCPPKDAFRCFMGTDLDMLSIENYLLVKKEQDKTVNRHYGENYELD